MGIWRLRIASAAAMAALGLGVAIAAPASNPNAADLLTERLREAALAMSFDGSQASGPGWEALRAAVDPARYVAIGEQSMSREIPAFATALCRIPSPAGGGLTLGLATRSVAAGFVSQALAGKAPAATVGALISRHPDAVAFLDLDAEVEMTAACAKSVGPARFHLAGLDQELFGSAGWLVEQMLATPLSPGARVAVQDLADTVRAADDKAAASGDVKDLWAVSGSTADLERVAGVLVNSGSDRSRELLDALRTTRQIYGEAASDPTKARVERTLLMKRSLAAAVDHTPTGRVLVKTGLRRLYRGYNPLHERDLGAWLGERGDMDGAPSVHIAIVGAQGELAHFDGYGRPLKVSGFNLDQDAELGWLAPALAARPNGDWTVFDLRRLRDPQLSSLPAAWVRLAEGYDFLIIAPRLTAAAAVRP